MASAKTFISNIRNATAEGEITPAFLAACLDAILDEAAEASDLPDWLTEQRLDSIGQTAASALQKAQEAANAAAGASNCTCQEASYEEYKSFAASLGIPVISQILL